MGEDGGGMAVIDFDGASGKTIEVRCGSIGTWTITYTVPNSGMAVGGGVKVFRVPNKYWLGQCKQAEDPKALDYVTTKRSDVGPVEFAYIGRFYKDHKEAQVRIKDTPMAAGSTIQIVFGDRSGGSPGAEVPYSWQPPCVYYIESDLDGDGSFARLPEPLVVVPVAGPAVKFVVDLPLIAGVGEKITLNIRAEDAGSNLAARFTGRVSLVCTDPQAQFASEVSLTEAMDGIAHTDIVFRTPGIHYVTARSADSGVIGSSNPIRITLTEPEYRIYWGDLHCHTQESDGTGSLDFNYGYARDVAWLDFIGVTDHLVWDAQGKPEVSTDGPIRRTPDEWNDLQSAAARKHHVPGRFVTFLGYEWSAGSERGGDHNVYYMNDRARVGCAWHLNDEYKDVRCRGDRAAFVIPHVGGRIADPKWHDPAVEPQVEINSMHGHFEWLAQEYLQAGHKVGFNGGSDSHFGLPGNDIWPNHGRLGLARRDTSVPQGTTCVFAPQLTRESIRDAIFARRTYATTCIKMLLEVSMDGHIMGEEYASGRPPKMHVFAAGTAPIARVEIVRGAERILNRKTAGKVVELDFTDDEPVSGTTWYYVRVSQSDGEIAWSSPIFFTYTGPAVAATRKAQAWNHESPDDEPGDGLTTDCLPDLERHLSWRAPGRFYDLKQIRAVTNPRGSYVLFHGRDRSNNGGKVHIRWYTGFDTERIHIERGWRDFGSERS